MANPNRKIQEEQIGEFYVTNRGGDSISDDTLNLNTLTLLKTNSNASGALLVLNNLGLGYDIYGTNGNFRVDKSGNIIANTMAVNSFSANTFSVSTLLTSEYITVNEDISVLGNLAINNNVNIQNQLTVIGNSFFEDVELNGLNVLDIINTEDLLIKNQISVSGSLYLLPSSSTIVSGSIFITEEVVSQSNITSASITNLTATDTIITNLNIISGIDLNLNSNKNFKIKSYSSPALASGNNPILFASNPTSPHGLYFYNGSNLINLTSDSLTKYEVIIPDAYLTPAAAIQAGITKFFIRAGTYNDIASGALVINESNVIIEGESSSEVIWKFDSLTINGDYIQIKDITLGVGEDNSNLVVSGSYNIIENINLNIYATATDTKLLLIGNNSTLENINEINSESKTFIKINGNDNRIVNCIGSSNITNNSSLYSLYIEGLRNKIYDISLYNNNLIYITGSGNSIFDSNLYGKDSNDLITIEDANNIIISNLNTQIENGIAFNLFDSSNITISNIKSYNLTSSARILLQINQTNNISNIELRNIDSLYYTNIIKFPSTNIGTLDGLYLENIKANHLQSSFLEAPGGEAFIKNVQLSNIFSSLDIDSNWIFYTAGGYSSQPSNWKILNCDIQNLISSSTKPIFNFDFNANVSGSSLGLNNLIISNCNLINGSKAFLYKGTGSKIKISNINYETDVNGYGFEFDAINGTILNTSLNNISVITPGHFLKLKGSSQISSFVLQGFNLDSSYSSSLTPGFGHFVLDSSSATIDYVVISSGIIKTNGSTGTIFNSLGGNATGHVHALIWDSNGDVLTLTDANWNENDNNLKIS